MGHLNVFVFAFALVIAVTQALQCWKCDNAISDKDCRDRGQLVTCQSNEEMCFTETRLIRKNFKLITRRCKQALACENNQVQNPRAAWVPSQCNNRQGSACRCCCDYDECNGYEKSSCSIGAEDIEGDIKNNPHVPAPCNVVEHLENGYVVHCDGDDMRTKVTCDYACLSGYTLNGAGTSVCVSTLENGPTEHQVPECVPSFKLFGSVLDDQQEPLTCTEPETPVNGKKECSSSDFEETSECTFRCDDGFVLEGEKKIFCKSDKDTGDVSWTADSPTCRPQCSVLNAPENGKMSCFDSNGLRGIGTFCMFYCNPGYVRQGEQTTNCVMDENGVHGYDHAVPTCIQHQCNALSAPVNGMINCDHKPIENGVGSVCSFTCEKGFKIVGEEKSTCVSPNANSPATYNHPTPVCEPIQCPIPSVLRRVVRKCTNGNHYSSQCQFQCERELYTANPGAVMDNHCQLDGTWSSPPPCCRLPCPPHTIMDLYIVLDSSSSVKRKNWNKTVQFVGGIISKLTLNKDQSQVSVIRFNENVDEENQLLLRENMNETQIRSALATIPYDGVGTKTGRALKYVRENLLKRATNRLNITDVVLLLTDGRASDDVKTISKDLRDDGVEMFAIGVGKARKKQLLEITGSREKLWAEMNNYDALTADAATRIGQNICEKSCA